MEKLSSPVSTVEKVDLPVKSDLFFQDLLTVPGSFELPGYVNTITAPWKVCRAKTSDVVLQLICLP